MGKGALLGLATASIAVLGFLAFALAKGSRAPADAVLGELAGGPRPRQVEPDALVTPPDQDATRAMPVEAPAQLGKPPLPPDSGLHTDAEFKRRSFQEVLDQFDGVPMETTSWPGFTRQQLCPVLMGMSVAAIMDAEGRSWRTLNDGVSRDVMEGGKWDHAFQYNGFDYKFRKGDFPVYDEWIELTKVESARQAELRKARAGASVPTLKPPEDLPYSEEFFARASRFAHGALALRP